MSVRERVPAILSKPDQGWSSLLLLVGMVAVLGLSIADRRPLVPVADGGSLTDSMVVLMVAATLIGYLLARSSIGVVKAHIIGAAVAAFLLLMTAGGMLAGIAALPTGADGVIERVGATWTQLDAGVEAFMLNETPSPPPLIAFLVLGAVCWTTAQFSAFSVFRYERGGPAVMATGTVLFLNSYMHTAALESELLPTLLVLLAFSALAMLLLMRLQLVQQRFQWARRHISDTGEVSRLFLRSGVLFVALAIVSAGSLTAFATVEAQEVEIEGMKEPLQDLGEEIARWLELVGVPRPEPVPPTRPDSWSVESNWEPLDGTAFTATVAGQLRGNYWWGWADDHYDGRSWSQSRPRTEGIVAGRPLPVNESGSQSLGPHSADVSITIGGSGYTRTTAFRPTEALVLPTTDSRLTIMDGGGGISDIAFAEPIDEGGVVLVESGVRDYGEDAQSLSANELRAAGEAYPPWVLELYLQGAENSDIIGDGASAMAERILSAEDNAYDQALMLQDELRAMAYKPDMRGVCAGRSIPECVIAEKQGFCQHYSTTMAMVLRAMDIPSRVITGYLPGELDSGEWTVPQAAYHNWVEVYFPEYGWVRFDPTPGREFWSAATNLPPGPDVSPEPSAPPPTALPGGESPTPEPSFDDEVAIVPVVDAGDGDQSLVYVVSGAAIVGLILAVMSALLLFRLRRLPDGDEGLAFRGIVSLATRLGYGPHPSQTEYEYADTLSEVIPTVRDDLHVVADARVETAYGQRKIGSERKGVLRSAYARIRTALLRLSLRRGR